MDQTPVHQALAQIVLQELQKNTPEVTTKRIVECVQTQASCDENTARKMLCQTLDALGLETDLFAPPDSTDLRWEFVAIDQHWEGDTCDIFQTDEFGDLIRENGQFITLAKSVAYDSAEALCIAQGTKPYNIHVA